MLIDINNAAKSGNLFNIIIESKTAGGPLVAWQPRPGPPAGRMKGLTVL